MGACAGGQAQGAVAVMIRHVVGLVMVAASLSLTSGPGPARSSDGIIKIGVLNDESGPVPGGQRLCRGEKAKRPRGREC